MKTLLLTVILVLLMLTGCKKSSEKGEILFCTNSNIINCPFSIEISIDNRIIDTLDAGSDYESTVCACPGAEDIGLILSIETGVHSYLARELECTGTNRVNSWSGNMIINSGDCLVIYLDVNE